MTSPSSLVPRTFPLVPSPSYLFTYPFLPKRLHSLSGGRF